MRQRTSPAPGMGQELDNNFRKSKSSISLKKPKEISHIIILKEIAYKWADRRCYRTLDRALIGGDL